MTAPDGVQRATLTFRVRFDEASPTGAIRSSTLLRYASDLAGVHSDRLGFSREWYRDHALAWLVRGVDLEVLGELVHGDEVIATTEVVGSRKVLARRRTEFRGVDGELKAIVVVDWVMTSAAGAPTRIPPDFGRSFGLAEVSFAPIRARAAAPLEDAQRHPAWAVRPQELDPMDHVNNAVYLDWAEEAVRAAQPASALDAIPRRWQLEYVRSAAPGDRIVATTWVDGPAWCVRIEDAATGQLLLGGRFEG